MNSFICHALTSDCRPIVAGNLSRKAINCLTLAVISIRARGVDARSSSHSARRGARGEEVSTVSRARALATGAVEGERASEGEMTLTSSRSAVAELLDPDLVARASTNDAVLYHAFVDRLESLYARTARDGTWTETGAAARCLKVITKFPVEKADVERTLRLAEAFSRGCLSVDAECAHDWCVGMTTLIDRFDDDTKGMTLDWEPMFACVETFLRGKATAYSGFGAISTMRSRYVKLVRKSRRFFRDGAAREIWMRVAAKCQAVEQNSCFEGLGLLHLFMPCMKMSEGGEDARFFIEMIRGEWGSLSRSMDVNMFWVISWMSIFAQLAKHDVNAEIEWEGVCGDIYATTLRTLELPIGGVEGRRSFGRNVTYRVALTFKSHLESSRRVRIMAKLLIYRAMHDSAVIANIEKIIDYIEHFYHPSSGGSYTTNLAHFMRYMIKYVTKFLSYDDRTAPPEVVSRMMAAFTRMTDKAVFSKSFDLRLHASIGIGRLAYIDPERTLPSVMSRFEEALSHETATRQLVPAMNCLTICIRQMMLLPLNTVFQDASEAYVNVNEFLASALTATLPGIDVNDSSKTCATLRLFCMVITNLPILIDVGEPGAISHVPLAWSEWTVQFLTRLFIMFENLQPDTHGSKSDAADAFKGGARGASGFLLSSSSMYAPLLRLLFERLDPTVRVMAIKRVASFIRENMLPNVCEEVAMLVVAALQADHELVVKDILRPIMINLGQDLVEDELSTTAEARIFWNSGILMKCVRANREAALAVLDDYTNISRRMFALSEITHNFDLAIYAEDMVCALVKGLSEVTIANDAAEGVTGDSITTWTSLKWTVDDNGGVCGSQHLTPGFKWRFPDDHAMKALRDLVEEFLVIPAKALIEMQTEDAMDCDDTSSMKDRIRTKVCMIFATLDGLRETMCDFSDDETQVMLMGHFPLFTDLEPRVLAARALVAAIEKTSADDTETLGLICSSASVVVNPAGKTYKTSKQMISAFNSNAYYFTQPRRNGTEARYPRWFIAAKVLRTLVLRNSIGMYFSGSSSPFNVVGPSGNASRDALVAHLNNLALSKYAIVRKSALRVIESLSERYPRDVVPLVHRSIQTLAKSEEDEDGCIAACESVQAHSALLEALRNEELFVLLVAAILGSEHHGTEKAQSAIGSLFLHFSLLFTRGLFCPRPRSSIVALKQRLLDTLKSNARLHWSYEMMTNAMTVFFLDSQDDREFISSVSEHFMKSVLGDLKVVRFPAMCALLMMSRYENFASKCAPVLKDVLTSNPDLACERLLAHFSIAHASVESGETHRRTNGKADVLMQAAESLYGFANEMTGSNWPTSRASEFLPNSGAFIVAVARFWMMLTKVAPTEIASGLRGVISKSSDVGYRSMRCAISEALAGALASRCVLDEDRQWMQETFLKYALDAPSEQREEWMKGIAYCTDSGDGNKSDSLLQHLSSVEMSTVAQTARSLELARVCIAQLGEGQSLDAKLALADILSDPNATPLAHDSRIVREAAAQLTATLLTDCSQSLQDSRAKLITHLTNDLESMTNRALASDPAHPDSVMTPSRNALEGIFYTFLELVRRGDVSKAIRSIPIVLRAALRTAETKDKDFSMVSKLTGAYLKYLYFEHAELKVVVDTLRATMTDENWHTRAATLRYVQSLVYHHAFTIGSELFASLRESVIERLGDKQLEVAQLASHTLMIFFKGVGTNDEFAIRDRFLKIATIRLSSHPTSDEIMRKHAAVLGLSACVLSNPHEVPEWMPTVMEVLGFASLEPSPIKQTTQRTFAEFKKTHQDTWTQTRAAFTHEQWENVTLGLELAPSYII